MDQAAADVARGPARQRSLAAVGATVVAVVATLVIPPWLHASALSGPSVLPQPPTPARTPDTPGSTTWQSLRCRPTVGHTCAAPREIDHGGAMLYTVGGLQQVVIPESPLSRQLRVTVPASRRDRWVLVGAEGAGSGSRLKVVIGADNEVTVAPGRLSLFSLPGRRSIVVIVSDAGTPRDHEVLRVQRYASH